MAKINQVKLLKFLKIGIVAGIFLSIISLFVANRVIQNATNDLVFSDINKVPKRTVGLLLGTAKSLKNGRVNAYYSFRIIAAMELYKAGKIKKLVISGDNSRAEYNEPQDMKEDLVALGFPANKLFLDYAGFRTFDSVKRIEAIFGQSNFTVISQEFHNRRAVYIAKSMGLDAIGYNAGEVRKLGGLKTQIREAFARVNVFIDQLFNRQPKFLGKKIKI